MRDEDRTLRGFEYFMTSRAHALFIYDVIHVPRGPASRRRVRLGVLFPWARKAWLNQRRISQNFDSSL